MWREVGLSVIGAGAWGLFLTLSGPVAVAQFNGHQPSASWDIAVLRGLDKITARTTTLEVPVGEMAAFGTFEVTVQACHKRPPEDTPETAAFLEVIDILQEERARLRGTQDDQDPSLGEDGLQLEGEYPGEGHDIPEVGDLSDILELPSEENTGEESTEAEGWDEIRNVEALPGSDALGRDVPGSGVWDPIDPSGGVSPAFDMSNPVAAVPYEEEGKDRIFMGWMFASSPGLHAVEHPVYDIWLVDCKMVPDDDPSAASADVSEEEGVPAAESAESAESEEAVDELLGGDGDVPVDEDSIGNL